ncbi:DUF2953 domain-containing protein [Shouchella miscanthi]|uniref:DUF2953 domain-containing protein n=1 Tax=Shouchella miscanthi TaxID=2598861 RepID=A0ABU6NPE4_9BACI|nr:DUF2953 domain-containing protein [Shouchella miscanthi]MED4130041.1 DUF2953 domain-containing protein [Shouchella miscanthi]
MLIWIVLPLIILLVILLIVLFIPIKIHIRYAHHQQDDLLTLYVYVIGLKVYTLEVPVIHVNASTQTVTVEEEEESIFNDKKKKKKWGIESLKKYIKMAKRLAAHFPKLKQLAYRFLGKVTCKHVTWKTEFGTGDAAKTAQLAGLIWTIKSMCLGWVQTKVNWKGEKRLEVTPHFQMKGYRMFLSCIVTFTLWHAMTTLLLLVISYKKIEKRFEPASGGERYFTQ